MAWRPDYILLAQLKNYMRIDDSVDDVELAVAITSASRAIDDHCNRQFGKVDAPIERVYTARYDYERCRWIVDIDDLQDDTGLIVEVDGTPITVYTLEPVNAIADGKAWTHLVVSDTAEAIPTGDANEIAMTAPWGWTTVPTPVTQAARLQASRFGIRRDSPYGIAGSPDQGNEMRLLARVDADVAVSLRGLRRARKVG